MDEYTTEHRRESTGRQRRSSSHPVEWRFYFMSAFLPTETIIRSTPPSRRISSLLNLELQVSTRVEFAGAFLHCIFFIFPNSPAFAFGFRAMKSSILEELAGSDLWEFESQFVGTEEQPKVVIGVDGGGTKTVCVCVATPLPDSAEDVTCLSRVETGSSNFNSVGVEPARLAIEKSMAGALKEAEVPRSAVLSVCLAAAGIDRQTDVDSYRRWISKIFPEDVEIFVQNDAVAALACGTGGKQYGCVLVAGTGTIALGFNGGGKFARSSGAGPLLGDQGSGYAIASQALAAVMRAEDGRGPKTSLTGAILKELALSSAEDLIGWVYADSSWARVAALVPVVKACAQSGDDVATELLESAVSELACSVEAVVKSLCLHGKDGNNVFPFVMVGGVLDNDNGWDIRKCVVEKVSELFPGAQPIIPKLEPALGSALLAWDRYSVRLSKNAPLHGYSS